MQTQYLSRWCLSAVATLLLTAFSAGIADADGIDPLPTTTVNTQIKDMDCGELKSLFKRIEKENRSLDKRFENYERQIPHAKGKVNSGNSKVSDLTRQSKNAKDSKEKKKIDRKLKTAQKSLERDVAVVQGFERQKAESRRTRKSLQNDERIASKVWRNKNCK